MNLRRKIYDKMMQWKDEKKRHKALIIEGMRQIGKSYIVEKFAKEQYKKCIFFDFRSNASHRDIFKGDFDLKTFKTNIVVLTGGTGSGKTVALYYAPMEYLAMNDNAKIVCIKDSQLRIENLQVFRRIIKILPLFNSVPAIDGGGIDGNAVAADGEKVIA